MISKFVQSNRSGLALRLIKGLAIVLTMMLLTALRPQTVQAQYASPYYYYQNGYKVKTYRKKRTRYRKARRYRAKRRYKRKTRARKPHIAAKPWPSSQQVKGPVQIIVSLPDQRMSLYKGGQKIASTRVSTGKSGHRTPAGIFSIIQKNRRHFSNLYNNAPMPYMQRITWSGVALHAGVVPNYPASHGCIRLPRGFAGKLFGYTNMGAHVVVADSMLQPKDVAHATLFQPIPAADQVGPRISLDKRASLGTGTSGQSTPAMISNAARRNVQLTSSTPSTVEGSAIVSSAQAATDVVLKKLASLDDAVAVQPAATTQNQLRRVLVEKMRERQWPKDVQKFLKRLGRYKGRIDGDVRGGTIRAIKNFQYGLGKRATGRIDTDLIIALHRISGEVIDLSTDNVKLPRSDKPLRILITRKKSLEKATTAQTLLNELGYDTGGIDGNLGRMSRQAISDFQFERRMPVTGALSDRLLDELYKASGKRKPGEWHLYVRQEFNDLFDVPVEVRDGAMPLGTHLFTAMHFDKDSTKTRWTSLTMRARAGKPQKRCKWSRKRRRNICRTIPAPLVSSISATKALDRIEISSDVREVVSELLTPGSSMVVTDRGISNETGKGTDFIVLTR